MPHRHTGTSRVFFRVFATAEAKVVTLDQSFITNPANHPARIIQFGEGNFLRAFFDWMIDIMNERVGFDTSVVVVQPISQGKVDLLNRQDGLFTVILQGNRGAEIVREKRLVRSVRRGVDPYRNFEDFLQLAEDAKMRFIVSNTTEAGIQFDSNGKIEDGPANTFPGKLTLLFHRRFCHFNGAEDRGFVLLPCELIENNGTVLKQTVLKYASLWKLGQKFRRWIEEANWFCNTLVDRIVTGYPADRIDGIERELGYRDELVVEGELFHLWIVEGPPWLEEEFPARPAGLNVEFVEDIRPHRTRKVRIMNGAHTCMAIVGQICGLSTVKEAVEDPLVGAYIRHLVLQEIIPTLPPPAEKNVSFADQVFTRFANPFIMHRLNSIALNSVAKWKTRVLPSVKGCFEEHVRLPQGLAFSLAALIAWYRGEIDGHPVSIADDPKIVEEIAFNWAEFDEGKIALDELAGSLLGNTTLWGEDLRKIGDLACDVARHLERICSVGASSAIRELLDSVENRNP
jgi:tagaturonate reductase